MHSRWLTLSLSLLAIACGSDDDKSCPDVDFDPPKFSPSDVQSGGDVTISFTVTSGSPSADCPVSATLSCGGKSTKLSVGPGGPGFETTAAVDCSGESSPTNCSYSFQYESPTGAAVGGGTGPTCNP